jgi:hypothetical protein
MDRRAMAMFLSGIGFGLTIAWMVEAVLVGRGVVSTYLGPGALLVILAGLLIGRGARL